MPFAFSFALAADLTPPRVFFSDAKISVTIPEGWNIGAEFPYGPLFTHQTSSGTSVILCTVSAPIDSTHMASDTTPAFLESFARADLAQRAPHAEVLAGAASTVATRHAYTLTWEDPSVKPPASAESVYFYNENRVYDFTLKADSSTLSTLAPEFQTWQSSVRFLSRQAHGQLDSPAHGGLWVHQRGGARILVPAAWLIGVADDRQLGATYASGDQHAEWTGTVDLATKGQSFSEGDKKNARSSLQKSEFQITSESAEPFHDLPAYRFLYQGHRGSRFVKGVDVWVTAPQGHWLFNIEADGPLFNKMGDLVLELWNGIQFLETPR